MHKYVVLFSLFFVVSAFKCSFMDNSKSAPLSTTDAAKSSESKPRDALEVAVSSTKVTGPLRVLITNGMIYGVIKTINEEKVTFETIDYGQEDDERYNVEETIKRGLLLDDAGEIGAPVIVFVEVAGGKFPCSNMITHDPDAKFCNHLVLETDDVFTKKLATDAAFRKRFGAMIGNSFEADVKNPYFKVGDVH